MITTSSHTEALQTTFRNSGHSAIADAPLEKGGGGAGFGPHELLEAALATCLNMAVRTRATALGIAVDGVSTSVQLDRSQADTAKFDYRVEIVGTVSPEDRQALEEAADNCPVRRTLAKALVFRKS